MDGDGECVIRCWTMDMEIRVVRIHVCVGRIGVDMYLSVCFVV